MNSGEIEKAIGAHGMWKGRLAAAIKEGHADVTPEQVEPDNQCPFGKWLHALPPGDRSDHFKKVLPLHAAFHKVAATVLRSALGGNQEDAKKSMAPGGTYTLASAKLTEAMMGWRKSLGA